MKLLLFNLILGISWVALTGDLRLANFILGLGLGYLALWLSHQMAPPAEVLRAAARINPAATARDLGGRSPDDFRKLVLFFKFSAFFLGALVKANFKVAACVLSPRRSFRPAIVSIPLDAQSDAEITTLANLITLTPGTLSLNVSPDRRVLHVHCIDVKDVEALRREIKRDFEKPIMELYR